MAIKRKNLIMKVMHEADFNIDLMNDKEIPKIVTYELGGKVVGADEYLL